METVRDLYIYYVHLINLFIILIDQRWNRPKEWLQYTNWQTETLIISFSRKHLHIYKKPSWMLSYMSIYMENICLLSTFKNSFFQLMLTFVFK